MDRHGAQGLTAGILIEAAKLVLGTSPDFPDTLPGGAPYSNICFDGTQVTMRAPDNCDGTYHL